MNLFLTQTTCISLTLFQAVYYCDRTCQKAGWPQHKRDCDAMAESRAGGGATADHAAGAAGAAAGATAATQPVMSDGGAAVESGSASRLSQCSKCGEGGASVWCRRCRNATYCSRECKKSDADAHASACSPVKKGFAPKGYKLRGCAHYERGCKVVAPCCGREFGCRMCHDEEEGAHCDEKFDRSAVTHVICLECHARQPPAIACVACGVDFGHYVCLKCNLFCDVDEGQ
jgi:hypothetical protein